uniref:Uncharacterized protein n=1 Tax=Candidatus Kentrum sp. UNK TaxID=2126344 RepID=A0A451AVU6_9GAMM|nr:MAG: hypothetical protein BECKUNK1418G_GA0071005_100933 [Candidatus Kentron sp. UNK]VFK70148.1 MAG: hypothetical protein BECKUNK1418H_GA0071006_102433 [Candidatus Kentron sp. UNK]
MATLIRFIRVLALTFTFTALAFLLLSFLSVWLPLPYVGGWNLVMVLFVCLAASGWLVFGDRLIAKRTTLIAVIGGMMFSAVGIYLLENGPFDENAVFAALLFATFAVLAGLALQAIVSWGKWDIAIVALAVLVLVVIAFSLRYLALPIQEREMLEEEIQKREMLRQESERKSRILERKLAMLQRKSRMLEQELKALKSEKQGLEMRERKSAPPPARPDLLPNYEWPPETPSWTYRILRGSDGNGVSLYEISERLFLALMRADYFEYSYYSAPGGFVMVTRLEAIDSEGTPLRGTRRFLLPNDNGDFEFAEYIRSLFFAPTGYYRFIAFVVTDKSYVASPNVLSETTALDRLKEGATALPKAFRDIRFSSSHRIDALIYEFRKEGGTGVETLIPGRIPPNSHLGRSGLGSSLSAYLP